MRKIVLTGNSMSMKPQSPPISPHYLILLNGSTNRGQSIQMNEPGGAFSFKPHRAVKVPVSWTEQLPHSSPIWHEAAITNMELEYLNCIV